MSDLTGAAENLGAVLRDALPDVTFDMGRIVEKRLHGSISIYASRDEEALSPRRLREIHEGAKWGDKLLRRARQARVNMPESTRSRIAEALRELLDDYVDPESDTVGHAFPMRGDHGGAVKYERDGLYTHANVSSTKRLAEALAQGAAVAGCDRVAELVTAWAGGAPMSYRTCTVIPITLARPLSPTPGIDLVPLPRSTDELPPRLPARERRWGAQFLGQTIVSVDAKTTPALFRPTGETPQGALHATLIPEVRLETIWDGLSLESRTLVDGGLTWDDYGEFRALSNEEGGVRGALSHLEHWKGQTTSMTGVSTVEIHEHGVVNLCEKRLGQRLHELHRADPRTRVSVSRWRSAMGAVRGLADRFIDLRIALECLFLPRQPGPELKFRLAVNGAWFVGKSGTDRRKVWDTLRSAYDLASAAVHQGTVKDNKENRAVLDDALEVCRKGILKVLHEGPTTDWTTVILDVSEEPRV